MLLQNSKCEGLGEFFRNCKFYSLDGGQYDDFIFKESNSSLNQKNTFDLRSEVSQKISLDKKKQHEVVRLAELVNSISASTNSTKVLDIGAGVVGVKLF